MAGHDAYIETESETESKTIAGQREDDEILCDDRRYPDRNMETVWDRDRKCVQIMIRQYMTLRQRLT